MVAATFAPAKGAGAPAPAGAPTGAAPDAAPDSERRPLDLLVVNWQDRENPQAGGAEIEVHHVFGRLAARGHRVALLCSGWPDAAPRLELDGMEVHRVGERYTFPFHARGYYRRHLADARDLR